MEELKKNLKHEQRTNIIADKIMDRLDDGTLPFNLINTVIDSIRGTNYEKVRLVIKLGPDYTQQVIFFGRFDFNKEKIKDTLAQLVDTITLQKGKPVSSVKIELLGIDAQGGQIPGSEREWEYSLQ